MANCCAIGRNSAEATKASLIRAARARLTALLALGLGLRELLPDVPGFFVACAGFLAVAFDAEELFFAVVVVDPPADCPATGCTTKSTESRQASKRQAWGKTQIGEIEAFILPL